ncbi:DUF2956 domain-containing protein [Shewanella sp. SR44-3]|uniref:DUF2956 domain-containing protein n=1 Tax=unclassified Shewanella TaxID=196818 RepID=UPI0015FA7031|nr:DUF2956 domain-containing protein [Shewanella sp. SR44-3]MBB1270194.1 DUF2956 domain-containing protein [Shewanella sp. SR44-3]
MKTTISNETQQDAQAIAKAIQKPGQTKEQTRLIAQGIEKGIAEYKKQHKAKSRQRDKARKLQLKAKSRPAKNSSDAHDNNEAFDADLESQTQFTTATWIAITLLLLSWAGFATYLFAV